MKKPLLFLLAGFSLAIAGCNVDCENGSGNEKSEFRNLKTFSAVETSGSVKLVLKQDSAQQVKITADDNVLSHIRTKVSGDVLRIEMDGNFCNTGPVTIYLAARQFSGLKTSGSVEVESEGTLNTGDFALDLSGSSTVTLDLSAADLTTVSDGSSVVTLSGQARSHAVKISGSGDIRAGDFVVGSYAIKSAGSATCLINVLNELDVKSSGSSDIKYRGNPASVNNHDTGSASVEKID